MRVSPGTSTAGVVGLMTCTLFLLNTTVRSESQNCFTDNNGMLRSAGANLWHFLASAGTCGSGNISVLLDLIMAPQAVSTGRPWCVALWLVPLNVS